MRKLLGLLVVVAALAGVVLASRGSLSPELRQMIGVMHQHNDRSARTCSELWVNHQGIRKEVNACVARFRQVYHNQPTNWAYANGLSETMVVDWDTHSTMQTLFARYPCVIISPQEERVYETIPLPVEESSKVGGRQELAFQPVPVGAWGAFVLLLAVGLLSLISRRRFA